MDLFETLSSDINPKPIRTFLLEQRIKMIRESITVHYESIYDLEKEIETLKTQLHDTPKTDKDHFSTLVDGDDVPPFSFV